MVSNTTEQCVEVAKLFYEKGGLVQNQNDLIFTVMHH